MKKFLRYGILFLLLCSFHLHAQRDSVLLKEVTVYGLPEQKYLAGALVENIDSSLSKNYSSNHLGEVLAIQFPVYFRSYGNGMISGISIRGTAPQHTAVLWNGINISSFSLGQSDFSILPMAAFDEIKIHQGGGSARFGSGAFGGTVLLNSVASQPSVFSIKQELGSFGRNFTSIKNSIQLGALTSSTSIYHIQAKNNFKIVDSNERQSHAAYEQRGIVQNLQYDFSTAKNITINYWYHDADREIQPTIGKLNSTDEQQDRSHRLSVSYQQNSNWGKMKVGGGLVDDVITYNNTPGEIFRWITFVNHQYTFRHQWHVQFTTDWNHIVGKIKEYDGEPVEDRVDVAGSLQKQIKKHSFSFNIRKPFITRIESPLLPYLGANILLWETKDQQFYLTANISKNFRAPTFNDRYWQNGGNIDLKPETSHSSEAGVLWKNKKVNFNAKGFYQVIDQWIQWVPDANAVYRPQNIKQVKARGFESSAEILLIDGDLKAFSRISYEYTHSTTSKTSPSDIATIGKQLIYTPIHTGNASLMAQFKKWSANVFVQYSGTRFTEASNSSLYALKSFVLVDFSLAKAILLKRNEWGLQFSIKNVFNQNYQLYSGRAMPGRNFNFLVYYQLKQKQL
jgi:vitamin B12 transporter